MAGDVVSYIRGHRLIRATSANNALNHGWYHYNYRGDVVQLTDDNGRVTRNYDFDPFGNHESDEDDLNPYRYTGEYYDHATGYIYLRARFYDPSIGRFINEDPALDGLNWYTYVYNNPINYTDPLGLWGRSVHYTKTKAWARQAGLSSAHANIVARANIAVDAPFGIGAALSWRRHFKAHGAWRWANDEYWRAVDRWRQAMRICPSVRIGNPRNPRPTRASRQTEALQLLGSALHTLQDYHAHLDWHIVRDGGRHTSWEWRNGRWVSSARKFDDPNYNVWRASDGYFYHRRVGKLNNPRYRITRDQTLRWIRCFIRDTRYRR